MLLCGAGSLPATEPRFGGAANGGQSAIFQVSGRLCQQRLLPQLYIGEVHGWEMWWFKVGPSESGRSCGCTSACSSSASGCVPSLPRLPWDQPWALSDWSPRSVQISDWKPPPQCGAQTWNLLWKPVHPHPQLRNPEQSTRPQLDQSNVLACCKCKKIGPLGQPGFGLDPGLSVPDSQILAPDGGSVTND
jgi:hypothetical protein